MRIVADRTICEGLGICESMAPDYFEVGDDHIVHLHSEQVEPEEEQLVRAAVDGCPMLALSVAE